LRKLLEAELTPSESNSEELRKVIKRVIISFIGRLFWVVIDKLIDMMFGIH